MKISEIKKVLNEIEKEFGDVPVRVWYFHEEDDNTIQVKKCYKSEYYVKHFRKNEVVKIEHDCVILELNGTDDTEEKIFELDK